MNNKAHLRPQDYDSNGDIIPMSMKEEKGDLVSRKWLTDAIRNRKTYLSYEDAKDVIDLINNVPTVKPCENCDLYFKAMTKEIDRWYRKEEQKGGADNDV